MIKLVGQVTTTKFAKIWKLTTKFAKIQEINTKFGKKKKLEIINYACEKQESAMNLEPNTSQDHVSNINIV